MSDDWLVAALGHVVAAGDAFGGGAAQPAERVNVEFVSANPTGPMTAAGGRHAAYGDSLARLLEFSGHDVTREYYINDIGGQVRRLGESIGARARGEDVPEGGYEGEYVRELAEQIPDAATEDPVVVGRARRARCCSRGSARRWRRSASSSTSGSRRDRCTPASRRRCTAPSRSSSGAARRTAPRARCGCARARTASRRTTCSSARPASRPTSPRTSPTTSTSASAASTG